MSKPSLIEIIDRELAEVEKDREALTRSRAAIARRQAVPDTPTAAAADSGDPRGTEAPTCDKKAKGAGPCAGELYQTDCKACPFTATRCERHGGQQSAGGVVASHKRHTHPPG